MDVVLEATQQTRQLVYHVAERSITITALDESSANLIENVFAEWYLTPKTENASSVPGCTIRIRTGETIPPVPVGGDRFEITENGVCYNNGPASYLELHGSVVVLGLPGLADVEVWIKSADEKDFPKLIRVISYAFSFALRRCGLFELHSAAVIEPFSSKGVLIVGPSGSGKSTLATQLASVGWSYLSDDVMVLGYRNDDVAAWPVRRCFAVTEQTFSASKFLQARLSFVPLATEAKTRFYPHDVFTSEFKETCTPRTLFFTQVTNNEKTAISKLSPAETISRLIRMSPWSCYEKTTAREHLAVLARLVSQCKAFDLFAGRDLLATGKASSLLASYVHD
jgi:hypothetical protein